MLSLREFPCHLGAWLHIDDLMQPAERHTHDCAMVLCKNPDVEAFLQPQQLAFVCEWWHLGTLIERLALLSHVDRKLRQIARTS